MNLVGQNNILVRYGCNPESKIHITWLLDVTSERAKKVLIHIPEDICERILAFFQAKNICKAEYEQRYISRNMKPRLGVPMQNEINK